jgi:hypothetical protein
MCVENVIWFVCVVSLKTKLGTLYITLNDVESWTLCL